MKIKALIAAMALFTGLAANAAVVSSSQNQTIDGQNFTFSLATPAPAANAGSKLSLTVQGDFNGEAGEFVTLFIEGVNMGTFGAASAGAYDVVDYRSGTSNFNAMKFSLDFLLSSNLTSAYLADGDIDVLVDFNSGVTANCGWSNNQNCVTNVGTSPFAQVAFDYQTSVVPEPASLALVGFGLFGLAVIRRRKSIEG